MQQGAVKWGLRLRQHYIRLPLDELPNRFMTVLLTLYLLLVTYTNTKEVHHTQEVSVCNLISYPNSIRKISSTRKILREKSFDGRLLVTSEATASSATRASRFITWCAQLVFSCTTPILPMTRSRKAHFCCCVTYVWVCVSVIWT